MEVYRRSSWLVLLLGFFFLSTILPGLQGEVDGQGPTESECRPYIEKALKELEIGEGEHGDLHSPPDNLEKESEELPTIEITTDEPSEEEKGAPDDEENPEATQDVQDAQEEEEEDVEDDDDSNEDIAEEENEEDEHQSEESLETVAETDVDESTEQAEDASKDEEVPVQQSAEEDEVTKDRDVDDQQVNVEKEEEEAESETNPDEPTEESEVAAEGESDLTEDQTPEQEEESDEPELTSEEVNVWQNDVNEPLGSIEVVDEEELTSREREILAESESVQEETAEEAEEEAAEEAAEESAEEAADAVEEAVEETVEEVVASVVEEAAVTAESQEDEQKYTDQDEKGEESKEDDKQEESVEDEKEAEAVEEEHSEEAPEEETAAATETPESETEAVEEETETPEGAVEATEEEAESIEDEVSEILEETPVDEEKSTSKEEILEVESSEAEPSEAEQPELQSTESVEAEQSEEKAVDEQHSEEEAVAVETSQEVSSETNETEVTQETEQVQPVEPEAVEQEQEQVEVEEESANVTEETLSRRERDVGEETESEDEEAKEEPVVEDLVQEIDEDVELRPREHVKQILGLDEESSEIEQIIGKTSEVILKELKKLYDNAIKPLETLYKYRDLSNRHFGDAEIFSKPLILFMGPWSGGKSTIINYLLDIEYNETCLHTGAEPSPAYFNILMHGDEPEVLDGTELAADYTFSGLQKFGQGLEERLRGYKLPSKLLEKVNIVEIPGILEVRKQVSRVFPFNDACQWFIDRADIIFLVYDPSKLDVGPETEAILDQLKGREYQTRILLNKADQVKPEELMRVQGALIWNISPLMSSAQPPIMYTTSLWSKPYEPWAPVRLLQAQERGFLRDLRLAVDKRIDNKIASARRFAVRVRNHAKMVDCYLTTYYNHKSVFGNRKQISDEIINHPQNYHIYEGLSTLTNISRYDLPDPDVYKDFFNLNALYDFQQLSATCTYFRGCPINRLDVAIAYDLPELVGKNKRLVESAMNKVSSTSTRES